MEAFVGGWLVGSLCGTALGVMMLFSREGIWPEVWIWLIVAMGAIGAFVGLAGSLI